MYFIFNPATIEALATIVQVLDQHPFGAIVLVLLTIATGGLVATAAIYL